MKLRLANEALALILELIAFGLLVYWGWHLGTNLATRAALAVAFPLTAGVLWGLFAAPRARFKVPVAAQLLVKTIVYGAAYAALATTDHQGWATAFAVVTLANTTAATIWRTREGVPGMGTERG